MGIVNPVCRGRIDRREGEKGDGELSTRQDRP